MQVTQIEDRVTHAVIGGQGTQSFGIAQTAEFFHILSSTLYSRKEEAMVREILCNAWDAHIEAGKTDTPIQIKLDRETFSIRDFGKGIPPELIVQIYGTYGGSTKKDNGSVTGGFGLGSKSPFAYVDHFEVTSCHGGTKTIYQMSLSSAMVAGKPSIATIVSVPSDETGVTVTVKLKSPDDYHKIHDLVEAIASFGEISIELNGTINETIPFSKATNSYVILHNDKLPRQMSASTKGIYVRYGNVVYPVEEDARYSALYDSAIKFLRTMSTREHYSAHRNWSLFLIAKPDTISVTPSRESLSMTDHTAETLTNLLQEFVSQISTRFQPTIVQQSKELIQQLWLKVTPAKIFSFNELPRVKVGDRVHTKHSVIQDITEVSSAYMNNGYPAFEGFKEQDFTYRLNTMIETGFGHTPSMMAVRKMTKVMKGIGRDYASILPIRSVVYPIYRGLEKDPRMDSSRLTIYDRCTDRWGGKSEPGFTPFRKLNKMSLKQAVNLARGIVVITYNRMDVQDRVGRFPAMRHWFGSIEGIYVYTVPRHSKKTQDARDYWEKTGLFIIDLTKRHSWEPADITEPVAALSTPTPKKIGLPILGAALNKALGHMNHRTFSGNRIHEDKVARIQMPEVVVRIPYVNESWVDLRDDKIDSRCTEVIARNWGDVCGVTTTATQLEKFVKMGSKKIQEFLEEKLIKEFNNNHRIKRYFLWSIEEQGRTSDWFGYDKASYSAFYNLLQNDPILRVQFGLPDPLPAYEKNMVFLYHNLVTGYNRRHNDVMTGLDKLVVSWGVEPKAKLLAERLLKSKLIPVINFSQTALLLLTPDQFGRQTQTKRQQIRDLILSALEG